MATTPSNIMPGSPSGASTPTSGGRSRLSPYAQNLEVDFYYHLGLDTQMDIVGVFGDVKYIVMMGSAPRAEEFANALSNSYSSKGLPKPMPMRVGKTERYNMFKVANVISVSHGMGGPSMHILMNELAKLCDRVGIISTVKWIRLGTSGGVGVQPGTVVVTTQGISEEAKPTWRTVQLGKIIEYDTSVQDMKFIDDIVASSPTDITVVKGKTMAANDFYEGQGRLDGALEPWYGPDDKQAFLKMLSEMGVKNIEMECVALLGFCNRANIPAACVCTTLLNRLNGDQITSTKRELARFNEYSIEVVANYIASSEANV